MSPQLLKFYSLSRALFFKNSCNKVSEWLFIVICLSTCHAHFQNNEIRISWKPTRYATVFFSYEMTDRKAGAQSRWRVAPPGFNSERNLPLKQKL